MEGMESEEPQVPPSEQSQSEKWYAPLTRITPLSKYLALALFIALPFVGFWMGMQHSECSLYSLESIATGQDQSLEKLQRPEVDNADGDNSFALCTDEERVYRSTDFLTSDEVVTIAGSYIMTDQSLIPIDPHPCFISNSESSCELHRETDENSEEALVCPAAVINTYPDPGQYHVPDSCCDNGSGCTAQASTDSTCVAIIGAPEDHKSCLTGPLSLSKHIDGVTSAEFVVVTGTLGRPKPAEPRSVIDRSYNEGYTFDLKSSSVFKQEVIVSKEVARNTCLMHLQEDREQLEAICNKYNFTCDFTSLDSNEASSTEQWYAEHTRFAPDGTWVIGLPVGFNGFLAPDLTPSRRDNRIELQYTCIIDAKTGSLLKGGACGDDKGCWICE